jgi:hypothetical protein
MTVAYTQLPLSASLKYGSMMGQGSATSTSDNERRMRREPTPGDVARRDARARRVDRPNRRPSRRAVDSVQASRAVPCSALAAVFACEPQCGRLTPLTAACRALR